MERSRADLHIHTTASDGALSPTQVVEEAANIGLAAIAISDHDTVDGIDEAMAAAGVGNVEVIPAVEINTDLGPSEVHILGYFVDWRSERLRGHLLELRRARLERGKKMVGKLQTLGVPVTFERVLEIAGRGSVGRPHVAQAIVEVSSVQSIGEAFARFLVRGAPAYVERTKLTPFEAVAIVVASGGVACLAHPGKSGRDHIIPMLVKSGLRAIEVYHSDQYPESSQRYHAVARKLGLIETGGSDAHGFDPDYGTSIGSTTVDMRVVEDLRRAAAVG
ncbi:MAG: PHP domain-containing protein [Armatimonadetes bacterium]|nr:PHP domain-containing protein [Armatimonadota bacterium]